MGDVGHQTFGLELAQCFAHERAADAQHLAQLTFDQAGPLRQTLRADCRAQPLGDLAAQRRHVTLDQK